MAGFESVAQEVYCLHPWDGQEPFGIPNAQHHGMLDVLGDRYAVQHQGYGRFESFAAIHPSP